jgi:DNA repair protein RadB
MFIWIFVYVSKKLGFSAFRVKRFRTCCYGVKVERLETGCEPIDSLLEGGIEKGIITNVFGESGTGKTNFAVQVAAVVAGKGENVAYIDTEGGFSPERFSQVAGEDALDNIFLQDPLDFDQQEQAVEDLVGLVEEKEIKLVVVDSAVSLYRLQVNGDNASEINQRLSQQLSDLSRIARKHNIPIVITNQVYTSFDDKNLELVGRDVPRYWSKCLLKLSQSDSSVRQLKIEKHRSLPEGGSVQFEITDEGLEGTDEKGLF